MVDVRKGTFSCSRIAALISIAVLLMMKISMDMIGADGYQVVLYALSSYSI